MLIWAIPILVFVMILALGLGLAAALRRRGTPSAARLAASARRASSNGSARCARRSRFSVARSARSSSSTRARSAAASAIFCFCCSQAAGEVAACFTLPRASVNALIASFSGRMRACGVHTYEAYGKVLDTDAPEYDRLLDALTINVTKFWRNAETWLELAPHLERLWRARRGHLRVWSAGCASGEEPYTLAVALAEAARAVGDETLLSRVRIDATDLDRESLDRTRAAEFALPTFSEMPPASTWSVASAGTISELLLKGTKSRSMPSCWK